MALLIDGYNLLHGTDLFGTGRMAGTLEGARNALVQFVLSNLDAAALDHTTIVFDAKDAPPGLPREKKERGLTIRFYADADELLEELIRAEPAPRRLTVVSSDHRVQRAAKRRRAKAIDSDRWWAELCDARRKRSGDVAAPPAKPTGSPSTFEVDYWVSQFADAATEDSAPRMKSPPPRDDIENPFPPGYAEDLLNDEFS